MTLHTPPKRPSNAYLVADLKATIAADRKRRRWLPLVLALFWTAIGVLWGFSIGVIHERRETRAYLERMGVRAPWPTDSPTD